MSGVTTLASTISTGGLSAGGTFIARNLQQATGNLASSTQTAASKMKQVVEKGKAGEKISGVVKNTKRIYITKNKYRIPDGLNDTVLSEVKNYSGTLSYTKQLQDFVKYSKSNGLEMHLYTNAKLTAPFKEAVKEGLIKVFPLK